MNGDEIMVKYEYECRLRGSFKCKRNEKLREVLNKISRELEMNIKNIYF